MVGFVRGSLQLFAYADLYHKWDSVQHNQSCGAYSNFVGQVKEENTELYAN